MTVLAQRAVAPATTVPIEQAPWVPLHRAADAAAPTWARVLLDAWMAPVVDEAALRAAIATGNELGAIRVLLAAVDSWEPVLQRALRETASRTLAAGAEAAALRTRLPRFRAAADPDPIISFAFDRTNPLARQWADRYSAQLVTDVSKSTRTAIRRAVGRAFREGLPPDVLARRIKPLIGLTDQQAAAVERLVEAMRVNRGGIVKAGGKLIRVTKDDDAFEDRLDRAVSRYTDQLLAYRAETIARTETIAASNEGQRQLWLQAVDRGLLSGDEQRVWIVTPDDKLCPVCEGLEGQVVGLEEDFEHEDGEPLSGPPAHPRCRCAQGLVAAESLPADVRAAAAHKYGIVMVSVDPTSSAAATINAAREQIADEDLLGDGKDVDGNHVTVRYGLLNEHVAGLLGYFATLRPFEARVGKIELFPASEHSDWAVPVVARVISADLHDIHADVDAHGAFKENSFPTYKPHITLAYVKPEAADKYRDLYVDGSFIVRDLTIGLANGETLVAPLGQRAAAGFDPSQPRDEQGRWTDTGGAGAGVLSPSANLAAYAKRTESLRRFLFNPRTNAVAVGVDIHAQDRQMTEWRRKDQKPEGPLAAIEYTHAESLKIAIPDSTARDYDAYSVRGYIEGDGYGAVTVSVNMLPNSGAYGTVGERDDAKMSDAAHALAVRLKAAGFDADTQLDVVGGLPEWGGTVKRTLGEAWPDVFPKEEKRAAAGFDPDQPRDESGKWTETGGSGGAVVRSELARNLREVGADIVLAKWGEDRKVDLSRRNVANRLAFLEIIANKENEFYGGHYGSKEYEDLQKLQRKAREEGWTGSHYLSVATTKGLISPEPTDTLKSPQVNRSDISAGTFWKGLKSSDERAALEDGYVRIMAGDVSRFSSIDAQELRDNGWSNDELERFADKLQAAGGSQHKWSAEGSAFRTIDAQAGELAFFSKDFDNFKSAVFSGWATASGTREALIVRKVAEEAFPARKGATYYQAKPGAYRRSRPDETTLYSSRAVDNLRRLKAETEQFYATKLDKPLKIQRAVGGHVEAYTPAAAESWTTDARTVRRFGKMMSDDSGAYSELFTQVTYRDVLWSYQSAASTPGWPPEDELKGKKEFVVLGRALGDVFVAHGTAR